MAQGTRGRWIRAATTGLGMVLCTGLVGCMNWDKPKDTKAGKQPQQLPGTPALPPNNGAAANTKVGQPYAGQPFGGPGANIIQPTGGFATSGAGGVRPGTTGLNTNTGAPPQQYGTWPPQPGNPGGIGSPTSPGVSVQPAGGPVGAAVNPNIGTVASFSSPSSPPPPPLLDPPLPPATGAAGRNEFANGPIQPPVPPGPLPPVAPPGVGPTYTGKGNF